VLAVQLVQVAADPENLILALDLVEGLDLDHSVHGFLPTMLGIGRVFDFAQYNKNPPMSTLALHKTAKISGI